MSNNRQNTEPTHLLDTLSDEQLWDILRSEVMSPEMNMERIRQVTELLDRRSGSPPPDVNAAWEDFKANYAGTKPLFDLVPETVEAKPQTKGHRKKPVFRAAVAAGLALVLVCTFTAEAMSYRVVGTFARWTQEVFGFASPQESIELNELLAALGDVEELVPSYIPEGYVQSGVQVTELHGNTVISSVLTNGDAAILLQYIELKDEPIGVYEKDDGAPETFTIGGVNHYITTNDGLYRAVWVNEGYECSISGVESREELVRIIDSIYE